MKVVFFTDYRGETEHSVAGDLNRTTRLDSKCVVRRTQDSDGRKLTTRKVAVNCVNGR